MLLKNDFLTFLDTVSAVNFSRAGLALVALLEV